MSDIFREVDEDLRREQFAKLWRRYGKYVIGAAVVFVLATGGGVAWREHMTQVRLEHGENFARALNLVHQRKADQAARAFGTLAEDASGGYAMLARFDQAAMHARTGDAAGAVDIYDELSRTAVDKTYRDLAVILSVTHSLDTADPQRLMERLEPLTADDSAWRYSALELTGLIARRAGDTARGREIFTRLAEDPAAPEGVRARAAELLQMLDGSTRATG